MSGSQKWGRGCSWQGKMGSSQHCSKQICVSTGVTLGPLQIVPNLFLTIVEPCTSYAATIITQMESFFTVELSGGIFHFGNVWSFSNVQPEGGQSKEVQAAAKSMAVFGKCLWGFLGKAQPVLVVEGKLWVSVFVRQRMSSNVMPFFSN